MMSPALIRTTDWEWALLVHVLGAMILVGGMVVVMIAALVSLRPRGESDAVVLGRFGFRTLLFVVWPSFIVTRVAAEWVRSEDPFPDEVDWIGIGYIVTDVGVLVLLLLTLLGWLTLRRLRRDAQATPVAARIFAVLAPIYLAALLVATWAMTTKPT